MKKYMLFALALMLSFVAAIPASAQNRGHRGNYGGYYGDSYAGSALQRSTEQTMGIVDGLFGELGYGSHGRYTDPYDYRNGGGYAPTYGYGRNYGYRYDRNYYRHGRGYRYGRHDTRDILLGTAAVVGGVWAIDKLANRHDSNSTANNGNANEEPSKCFERIVKAAKKQGVPVDPNQVMAVCSGQQLQQPEPERMSERAAGVVEQDGEPEAGRFTPVPTTTAPASAQHVYRGAYRENGRLCNDNDRPLTVLINGRVVGTVAPGSYITISRLPAGQLSYRY